MEQSGNGRNNNQQQYPDIRHRAIQIFDRTLSNQYPFLLSLADVTAPTGFDFVSQAAGQTGAEQQLISSVSFSYRYGGESRDEWRLESIWDNVDIGRLDNFARQSGTNDLGFDELKAAMAGNINLVLLRIVMDWSRQDGGVESVQIAWSGCFADCNRVLEVMERNSPNSLPLEFRYESLELHPDLRDSYIASHRDNPFSLAVIVALALEPMLTISITDTGDGEEIFCAICQEILSENLSGGEYAKRLHCNHVFHEDCIIEWFLSSLSCPLCRRKY